MDRLAIGAHAEAIAARHLEREGWEILARNLRLGHLEVDLVARKDDLAVLVEVRTRRGGAHVGALASVASRKRARLLHAADRLWRFHLARVPGVARMRIDVVAVVEGPGGPRVVHARGAVVGGLP